MLIRVMLCFLGKVEGVSRGIAVVRNCLTFITTFLLLVTSQVAYRSKGQVDERKKVLPRVQTMLFLCKRNAIQKTFFPKSCSFSQKVKKKIQEKTLLIFRMVILPF